jgi:hypothetical protein
MQSFWRRRVRPAQAVADVDPADMGTCYGLEMSLAVPGATEPASARREPRPWWEQSGMRKSCGA